MTRLLAALIAIGTACAGSQVLGQAAKRKIVFEVVNIELASNVPLAEITQADAHDLPATIRKLKAAGVVKNLHKCRCSATESERAEVHSECLVGDDVESFGVTATGTVCEDGQIAFDFSCRTSHGSELSEVNTFLRTENRDCVCAGGSQLSIQTVSKTEYSAKVFFVTASYELDPGDRAERIWGGRVGDFQLSARTNKPEYAAGEDVALTLETKNTSSKQARFRSSPVFNQYQFEVLSPDGSKAPLTLYGREQIDSPIADVHGYPLEPGASNSQRIPALNRVFDMTRAGEYRIVVRRPSLGPTSSDTAAETELVSNPVTIRIGDPALRREPEADAAEPGN